MSRTSPLAPRFFTPAQTLLLALLVAPVLILLPLRAASPQSRSRQLTVPAGTVLMVRLNSDVSTRQHAGARFETTLTEDVHVGDVVVARAGAPVYGAITRSEGGKRVGKQSLAATLTSIRINGRLVHIVTDTARAKGKYGGGLAKVGAGTLLGAAIGGGTGALIGAAGGGAATALSKERHITVPAGSVGSVRLLVPLVID